MKPIIFLLSLCVTLSAFAQEHDYLLVGTYTTGKSKGIYVYDFNSKDGSVKIVDSAKTPNPSFLAVSPNQKFVYAVFEEGQNQGGGKVASFRFDKSAGHITPLNQQPSMGNHPCYVAVDKTGDWVFVANYTSGSVGVLPVLKDGRLGKGVSMMQHKGSGPNQARQQGPHVHSTVISNDNRYLFVQDLGIDKVMIYSFNDKTGSLQVKDTTVKLKPGSGPRHFDFHPNGKWAYLIQEMAGTVTAFNYHDGNLQPMQTISVLPEHYSLPFTSADIHVSKDGKFLYTSTRDSSNTIAIFQIDPNSGKLKLIGHQSTLGKTPRNFNFDPSGNYLLVANQNSDSIVIFKIDRKTGLLTDTGKRIDVGNPVCIKWITR